jgi:hypothetical protein
LALSEVVLKRRPETVPKKRISFLFEIPIVTKGDSLIPDGTPWQELADTIAQFGEHVTHCRLIERKEAA